MSATSASDLYRAEKERKLALRSSEHQRLLDEAKLVFDAQDRKGKGCSGFMPSIAGKGKRKIGKTT